MLAAFDVLVFSKTAGFRHDSIDEGQAAILSLGASNDFTATITENASIFSASGLAPFEAVVFLNTTGDILNASQQIAFENFIRSGGGYVGIHSASDTEYGWAWYGQLVGAYFAGHPAIQQATVNVEDHSHASTATLPDVWVRTDEWYNLSVNPRGSVQVLAALDETTYSGGAMGSDHPISWYHYFDGGRSWYTGMGHTASSYSEPLFRNHLLGGIQYAAGRVPAAPQRGDYNLNSNVDAADYVVWRATLNATGDPPADGDGSGQVDPNDHVVWRANFGAAKSASAHARTSSNIPRGVGYNAFEDAANSSHPYWLTSLHDQLDDSDLLLLALDQVEQFRPQEFDSTPQAYLKRHAATSDNRESLRALVELLQPHTCSASSKHSS
jgi:type 1 glutamine amidotransferase